MVCPIRPGTDADAIARAVGERPVRWRMRLVDDTAARSHRCLEPRADLLARAVSEIARQHGAVPDRAAVQEVQVAIAAKRDAIDVQFWRAVLGYTPMADDNAVDPLGHGSTVWMQELDQAKPLRHAMHIDVSVARERAKARLEAAVAAGGRIVDESQAPSYWTLADRAGNRVCICAWPDGATQQLSDGPA